MARLVKVCKSNDFEYERRQIPLVVDETLTMVVQFEEKCVDCDNVYGIKHKDLERFVKKFSILSNDELAVAMMVTTKDIMSLLAHTVPCVGCRRSVERLCNQLVLSQHPALEPLILTPNAILSVRHHYLFDPRSLYALFYIHGAKLNSVMESIPKSKKNKRCNLHSLETHKTRITGGWIDTWDVLSRECREEVVLVEADNLLDTLETYLRKHRFCSECKSKVMRAYDILVGDVDSGKDKSYCPALYKGLRCCPQKRHIHMLCDTDFIAHLIGRAEPELAGGNRRDRHAKTLDVAQEEVLTCLGIHIYERLHRISQKLKAEEQTWQILFYLGVDALKKSFEVAVEMKQGVSNLELMCEELLEEERVKEQRREQKRQKRKKKKARLQLTEKDNTPKDFHCTCDSMELGVDMMEEPVCSGSGACVDSVELSVCEPRDLCPDPNSNTHFISMESCDGCDLICSGRKKCLLDGSRSSDCGYSSDVECCENCDIPSSNDGSDIVCSDGVCTGHDGLDSMCSSLQDDLDSCHSCLSSNSSPRHTNHNKQCNENRAVPGLFTCLDHGQGQHLSLQDMLEASCSSGEEGGISEEEIRHFKANEKKVHLKRLELREMLKQRFHNFQQSTKSCQVLDCVSTELCDL